MSIFPVWKEYKNGTRKTHANSPRKRLKVVAFAKTGFFGGGGFGLFFGGGFGLFFGGGFGGFAGGGAAFPT